MLSANSNYFLHLTRNQKIAKLYLTSETLNWSDENNNADQFNYLNIFINMKMFEDLRKEANTTFKLAG